MVRVQSDSRRSSKAKRSVGRAKEQTSEFATRTIPYTWKQLIVFRCPGERDLGLETDMKGVVTGTTKGLGADRGGIAVGNQLSKYWLDPMCSKVGCEWDNDSLATLNAHPANKAMILSVKGVHLSEQQDNHLKQLQIKKAELKSKSKPNHNKLAMLRAKFNDIVVSSYSGSETPSRQGCKSEVMFHQIGAGERILTVYGAVSTLENKAELAPELVDFWCSRFAQTVPATKLKYVYPTLYDAIVGEKRSDLWGRVLQPDESAIICVPVFATTWTLVAIYRVPSGIEVRKFEWGGTDSDASITVTEHAISLIRALTQTVGDMTVRSCQIHATARAIEEVTSGIRLVSCFAALVQQVASGSADNKACVIESTKNVHILSEHRLKRELEDALKGAQRDRVYWAKRFQGWGNSLWPCRVLNVRDWNLGSETMWSMRSAVIWFGEEDEKIEWVDEHCLKPFRAIPLQDVKTDTDRDDNLEKAYKQAEIVMKEQGFD